MDDNVIIHVDTAVTESILTSSKDSLSTVTTHQSPPSGSDIMNWAAECPTPLQRHNCINVYMFVDFVNCPVLLCC